MGDLIRLSSGKEVYANNLILGIGPDLQISGGYDQGIPIKADEFGGDGLSPAEVCELADIAIDRWNKLKAAVQ